MSEGLAAKALLLEILTLFGVLTASPSQDEAAKNKFVRDYTPVICVEAVRLQDWLSRTEEKDPGKHIDTLENIIAVFEDLVRLEAILCCPPVSLYINESKFTKLPTLRQYLKSTKLGTEFPTGVHDLFDFDIGRDGLALLVTKLNTYNNCLITGKDTVSSWWPQGKKRKPAYEIRQHAITLYRVLSENWPACGQSTHKAKICLSLYEFREELNQEVNFELFFSTHSMEWLESQVRVLVEGKSSSRIRWAEQYMEKPSEQRLPAKNICKLIENTSTSKRRLRMLIDYKQQLYHTLSAGPARSGSDDVVKTVSMRSLLERLQLERLSPSHSEEPNEPSILDIKEQRAIAVLLSHAVLHFCGSLWLSEKWDHGSISFLSHHGRSHMVLSTDLQPKSQELDLGADERMHRYPAILTLGIVLLEMELKKTIETLREESSAKEHDPNIDSYIAMDLLEELEDNAPLESDFVAAVKACVSFSYEEELSNADETGREDGTSERVKIYDNLALRRKIYQEIVAPLEREFCKSFGISSDKLNKTLPLTFSFWDRSDFSAKSPVNDRHQDLMQPRIPSEWCHENTQIDTYQITKAFPSDAEAHLQPLPVFFHEFSTEPTVQSKSRSKEWIDTFTNARDLLMGGTSSQSNFESLRVKVAVLDTGIDLTHPFVRGALDEGRIKEWKNWTNDVLQDPTSQTNMQDTSGHGTHITSLLLKIAPETDIYIGRVAAMNESIIAPEKLAEAINYAAEVWKVDIITMSFGFRKENIIIRKAIKDASSEDIIMFAATSNDGDNFRVAFPAKEYDTVIGVNSTNTFGGKSEFSPSPRSQTYNFGILGEAVESSWPKSLGKGSKQCRSGTSYATPIAAGTASIMLFYARLKMRDQEMVAKLKTCRGMKSLLASMSMKNSDGYNLLQPWLLWEEREDIILAHILTHVASS